MGGAYRQPSAPERIAQAITLPPHGRRRAILGVGLWFMAFWFLVFAPAWILDAFITGEDVWLIAPALLIPVALVWGIARTMRLETIYVGNIDVRRAGFFREHAIAWRDVTGSKWITRAGAKGRRVRLLLIEGRDGKSLLVAPHQVEDPDDVLSWAIGEAKEGRAHAIDDRVRRDGERPHRSRGYLVHGIVAFVLFTTIGAMLLPMRVERHAERRLRVVESQTSAERISVATEIADHPFATDHVRCSALSMITHAQVQEGRADDAARACAEMQRDQCLVLPYDDCSGVAAAAAQQDP